MSGYSLNNKKNDSDERVDAAGNPLHVANLTFVPGAVLGRGSFGTVRLAKRSRRDAVKNQQQQHVRHESLPVLQLDATKVSSSCSKQQQPKAPTANTDNCGGDLDDSSPTVSFHDSPRPNYSSPNQQNNNTTIRELFDQAQQKQQVQLLLSPPTFKAMLPSFHRRSHSESAGLFGAMNESTTTDHERKELGTSDNKALRADDPQQQLEDEQDQLVAVKIFRKSILKRIRTMEQCSKGSRRIKVKTALETVEREIALMKKLQHPNLVEFYEAVDSPESDLLYMVIEYMPLGEILTYQNDGTFRRKSDDPIDGIVNGHFDEYHAALYFVDIMHGLAYLHQHHIIHRDLKPENVLLDARGIAKLSDFGVSHMFDDDDEDDQTENRQLNSQESDGSIDVCDSKLHQSSTRLTRRDTELALEMAPMNDSGIITKTEGTWAFWSPEMCEGGKAFSGYAADIWAAGVCLYVFVTGKLPFFTDVPIDLLDMIKEAKVPYDGLNLSDDLLDLLQMTLNPDPASRAGVGDCLKHPFLLRARAERVQSLSAELAKSEKRSTIVEEIDLQSALRIVTLMPVEVFKSATKHLQRGYQAVKHRVDVVRSSSFDAMSQHPSPQSEPKATVFTPNKHHKRIASVTEDSLEFSALRDDSTSRDDDVFDNATPTSSSHPQRITEAEEEHFDPKIKSIFKFPSFGTTGSSSMGEHSENSLLTVFGRKKRDSDCTENEIGHRSDSRLSFFGRHRSDVSGESGDGGETEDSTNSPFHSSLRATFHSSILGTFFNDKKGPSSDDDRKSQADCSDDDTPKRISLFGRPA